MAVNEVKRTKAEAREALIQRRAAAHAHADQTMAILQAAAEAKHHQAALVALDRMIVQGRVVKLDTLEDLVVPQVWVVDARRRIVDHLLTVDAACLGHLVRTDGMVVASIGDALRQAWRTDDAQAAWAGVYAQALAALANQARAHLEALRAAASLRATLDDRGI